jgi:hypothetical protein
MPIVLQYAGEYISSDFMDDNLDHVRIEWLRRLERCEVPRKEAQGVLLVMKARLEFLRNLHSNIANHDEFAEAATDLEQDIERQADEIKVVEGYTQRANGVE